MDIVYYPDILVYSENTLKYLLLFWDTIRTIVPLSEKWRIDSYFEKTNHQWQDPYLERYREVLDLAGEPILDYITITQEDKQNASQAMFNLVAEWNQDSHFYNSLKMDRYSRPRLSRYSGHNVNPVETYSLFEDKMETSLRDLLLDEKLLVRENRQLVGSPQIGKIYMSLIAKEIKKNHNIGLITDDEFCAISKSNAGLKPIISQDDLFNGYQIVAINIPQIFIPSHIIQELSWKQIIKIRRDLVPLSEQYYLEIEKYQNSINSLQNENRTLEALAQLKEFCERSANSFKPFSKEISKLLGTIRFSTGLITNIIIPFLLLSHPEFNQILATMSLAITSTKYFVPMSSVKGFDYLLQLNRSITKTRFSNMITKLSFKSR